MIATGALLFSVLTAAPPQAAHAPDYWRAIVKSDAAPPAGANVAALAAELVAMLASPDPELRDDIAYTLLASWIYQKRLLDPAALGSLTSQLLSNLRQGIGARDGDGVFRRSFSALTLAAIVARDNADPFLDAAAWRRIADAAVAYLDAEQDLRGYDPGKGWMHSAAHTADLVRFLARSRFVEPADQERLLDAVARKLTTAGSVFTHGEDERFARALLSIVNRKDFDRERFAAWIARTKPALPAKFTAAELAGAQNRKNLFAKLEVLLSNDPQPAESVAAARDALRAALKTMF